MPFISRSLRPIFRAGCCHNSVSVEKERADLTISPRTLHPSPPSCSPRSYERAAWMEMKGDLLILGAFLFSWGCSGACDAGQNVEAE